MQPQLRPIFIILFGATVLAALITIQNGNVSNFIGSIRESAPNTSLRGTTADLQILLPSAQTRSDIQSFPAFLITLPSGTTLQGADLFIDGKKITSEYTTNTDLGPLQVTFGWNPLVGAADGTYRVKMVARLMKNGRTGEISKEDTAIVDNTPPSVTVQKNGRNVTFTMQDPNGFYPFAELIEATANGARKTSKTLDAASLKSSTLSFNINLSDDTDENNTLLSVGDAKGNFTEIALGNKTPDAIRAKLINNPQTPAAALERTRGTTNDSGGTQNLLSTCGTKFNPHFVIPYFQSTDGLTRVYAELLGEYFKSVIWPGVVSAYTTMMSANGYGQLLVSDPDYPKVTVEEVSNNNNFYAFTDYSIDVAVAGNRDFTSFLSPYNSNNEVAILVVNTIYDPVPTTPPDPPAGYYSLGVTNMRSGYIELARLAHGIPAESIPPPPSSVIISALAHEIGHLLGVGHWSSPNNLMVDPSASSTSIYVDGVPLVLEQIQAAVIKTHLCSVTSVDNSGGDQLNFKHEFQKIKNPHSGSFENEGGLCGNSMLDPGEECEANFHAGHRGATYAEPILYNSGWGTYEWIAPSATFSQRITYITPALNLDTDPPSRAAFPFFGIPPIYPHSPNEYHPHLDQPVSWCSGAHSVRGRPHYDAAENAPGNCKLFTATPRELHIASRTPGGICPPGHEFNRIFPFSYLFEQTNFCVRPFIPLFEEYYNSVSGWVDGGYRRYYEEDLLMLFLSDGPTITFWDTFKRIRLPIPLPFSPGGYSSPRVLPHSPNPGTPPRPGGGGGGGGGGGNGGGGGGKCSFPTNQCDAETGCEDPDQTCDPDSCTCKNACKLGSEIIGGDGEPGVPGDDGDPVPAPGGAPVSRLTCSPANGLECQMGTCVLVGTDCVCG